MATGSAAAKLQAEAPVGTQLTARLILQPAWAGVIAALGGGPVLVKNGKPVFRSLEDFTNDQVSSRAPRAGVGQLADGRVLLVAVDGGEPGYSAGMTSFELAQTLQRLGAVTASAVESGGAVTAAFDGRLLDRPSDAAGERAGQGGAAGRVFRRLLAAAAAAPERRSGPDRRAARGQARAPVDGDRRADRPRRRAARARERRRPSTGRLSARVQRVRRRRCLALARAGHRRSRPSLDRRPGVPLRHDALGSERRGAGPRQRRRPVHAGAARQGAPANRDEGWGRGPGARGNEPRGRGRASSSGTACCPRARAPTAARTSRTSS